MYICETNKINMKKFFYSILFLITFTLLFIQVGSTVVDMIMTLIPMSAQEWFPLIKLIIWVFTFSFNLMLTIFITYLIAAVVSLIFK